MTWPYAVPAPPCICAHKRIAHFTPHRQKHRAPAYQTIPCSLCACADYEARA